MIQRTAILPPLPQPFMEAHEVEAITVLLRGFDRPLNAFEWGSGASTLYFGTRLPSGSFWQSLEHDPTWYEQTAANATQWNALHLHVQHIPPDRHWTGNGDDGSYETFRRYVLYPTTLNKTFSLILVDGRARIPCMAVGWELLEEDGVMILHDAERDEYKPGIPDDCFHLQVSGYSARIDGMVTCLFMAKTAQRLSALQRKLTLILPATIYVTSNIPDRTESKRILFANVGYESFFSNLYNSRPDLAAKPYYQQKRTIIETCFGDSDYYSSAMEQHDWLAEDLFMNCAQLQKTWALEKQFPAQGYLDLLIEQIRQFCPDVLYMQELSPATASFLEAVRPFVKLVVGQIASPIPPSAHLQGFDIIFSSFPHFVERFRKMGITSYYQPLAFEPRILQRLPSTDRIIPLSFVGGISPFHGKGLQLLEEIARGIPLDVWGYGAQNLHSTSPLLQHHHGEAWGIEMYALFASSNISLNRHIDVAEGYANNLRLFETTGCGALLLTDNSRNLDTLFNIGQEIITYKSPEEAVGLAQYYLKHPEKAAEIAKAGQDRTIREHNYTSRMTKVSEILERHLEVSYSQQHPF